MNIEVTIISALCVSVLSGCGPMESDDVARGSLCGIKGIQGDRIDPIVGTLDGCGVSNPVQVTEIAGVQLSQGAIMECDTARALHTWVTKSAKPAVGRRGGGLDSLRVAAHYACRSRNSQSGAKISEHGKGRAIDISAFVLQNGEEITVQDGWTSPEYRKILREMHQSACGPFGTVLGPESDRFHQDHFHFDTADYRSGPYCR
ncbi:extensin family protein [Parasulfitobacter algicola]|uniref:Extensin family protein n=1 Tax=Parasulfitobacter algicola TaxID=2614809 RepID=A0ABX2IPL2_9RHOB|nr:extensin family protein [Sulfitobacter algicola]NSX54829.1 extensin family protein [Sulfitobacter algicola]